MDRGRGNHLVELKAYSDTAHAAFTKRGVACDTHAFPHEENLIRSVKGVAARPGERPWDRTEGVGRVLVEAHLGAYDDAIRVKHNTVTLYLVSRRGHRHWRAHHTYM